ncbi:hypothetical protein DL96DRAFT_1608355 [Flagelloscypha sp. PMI_526]|nr:hypothetical protein DL96DRAFT_1608355 [Flagelloscypha sp. PMI_526]
MLAFHQAALFASVELVCDNSDRPCGILNFHRIISGSTNLGRLVRTLVIKFKPLYYGVLPGTEHGNNISSALAGHPPLLPNVTELRLRGKWPDKGIYHDFIQQASIFWRQTLRILFVDGISRHVLPELLFGWKALEHLELNKPEAALFRSHDINPSMTVAMQPSPSRYSFTAVLQKMLQGHQAVRSRPPRTQTALVSVERTPTIECTSSLERLTLHFEPKLNIYTPFGFTAGSDLFRFYGPTLSKLHITGNPSDFTVAPGELPSLRYLRIDVLPIFVQDPVFRLVSFTWLIQFVRQRSSANGRVIRWNLKEIQLDAPWFPGEKTRKSAMLLQLQALAQALVEFNETTPKLCIASEWGKASKWENFVRDLDGVGASVKEVKHI